MLRMRASVSMDIFVYFWYNISELFRIFTTEFDHEGFINHVSGLSKTG